MANAVRHSGGARVEVRIRADGRLRVEVADDHPVVRGGLRALLGYFAAPPPAAEPFPELTARERQVLDLIAAGRANAQIARALAIAPKTVADHISAIFTELRVADRSAVIVRARRAGFGLGGGPRGPRGTVRDVPDRDTDTGM
ncbi:response regulator transcription factor [Actinomadura sp. LCR2-06]|uniref:Response regulator transcription factor n=2 Tax=Actinomadura violacea TaxID=2819934 RepID=A0ABS3S2Z4_9ACTN|nr:response regulator transcription factor [Actinomadura violacea]